MSSRTNNAARQHGAMEHTDAPCDLDAVRHYRLARVRQGLASHDLAGIVLYDQVNTRYVTDSTNMQIWSTHNEVRYVYVPTEAELHRACIAAGAEWFETRLLSSGPRTNPWARECSMRIIERGDMVSFDTDLIGPYGYCCDISRSWVCDAAPNDEQRRIYADAYVNAG